MSKQNEITLNSNRKEEPKSVLEIKEWAIAGIIFILVMVLICL